MITKQCECCSKEIQVKQSDLDRGWGRFCSKACGNTKKVEGSTFLWPVTESADKDWSDDAKPVCPSSAYAELQAQYEQLQTMLFNQKLQTKRVTEALQELMNSVCGDQKSCDHQFECVCAMRQAKAALSASEPVVLEGLDTIISRRADIEQRLFNVANGKAPMLTKTDCRIMALRLGTPKEHWNDIIKKHKWGE